MRALRLQWSWAFSLVCEMALNSARDTKYQAGQAEAQLMTLVCVCVHVTHWDLAGTAAAIAICMK